MSTPLTPHERRLAATDVIDTESNARSRSPFSHARTAAYRRLGVAPNTVLTGPKCTPFFEEIGGIPMILSALRASPAPEARAVMSFYDDPTRTMADRKLLPLEAFCAAANVCPSRLIEVAVAALAKHKILRGAVIAAMAHPDIMETNVAVAQTDEGVTDRMAHFKMVGAMPSARGSQTVVNVNASAHSASLAASESAGTAPPAEDTIRRIVEARQAAAAAIAAGHQEALPPAPDPSPAFQPKQREHEPVIIEGDPDEDE